MGAAVAKQPKKRGRPPEPAADKSKNKTAMVRLDPEFQRRLARVTKDANVSSIGEFIEMHMRDMVNREFKRIVLAEAQQVQGE